MLNEEQKKAVNCEDKYILCLAGAGTGKTYTMLERVHRLIDDHVSPDSILVLTFTRAAALEMKERFKENNKMYRSPLFCTFHAFCYSLIIRDANIREKLGYSKIPWIATDYQIKKIQEEAKKQTGIKLSDKKLNGPSSQLTMKESKDLEILHSAELRLMKLKNLITFDHLCYDVCKLFKEKSECISQYISQYQYIFVDEFQDTDPKQYEFIQSFEDSNIFVVGDALQSIYSFRGADSSIIKGLAEDPKWTTIKLHQNYRSTEPICNFANKMSRYANDSFRIAISSHKYGEDVHTEYMSANSRYSIYDENCLTLCKEAASWEGRTAILCRTNAEVKSIQKMYTEEGLPYSLGLNADIGLHIIQSCLSEEYQVDWLASILSNSDYGAYLTKSKEYELKDECYPISQFKSQFGNNKQISEYLNTIDNIKALMASDKDVMTKWFEIFNMLSVKPRQVPEELETDEQILEGVKSALSGTGEIEEDSVYIGTIHSVKGLEYDNVILVAVGGKSFPLTEEENKNLYYVGITRAISKLYVMEAR